MLTAFDMLLIAIAIVIMAAGFRKRWAVVKSGRPQKLSRDLPGLIRYLFGHDKILQNRKAGWAHLFVFFGFFIPLTIIILSQFDFALPLPIARGGRCLRADGRDRETLFGHAGRASRGRVP